MGAAGDMRAAQLVTLPQASERIGKPTNYFTVRRGVFRTHKDIPFPTAVTTVAGSDVFDMQELVVWNERRILRDKVRRETWVIAREERQRERAEKRARREEGND